MTRFYNVILTAIFGIGMLAVVRAAERPETSEGHWSGTFQLKASKGLLSLKADDAALVQIFEEIGKHTSIIIDSNIPPGEKITIRFDNLSLEDGIKQLARNVTVFYAQDDKARRIERVVILDGRSGALGPAKESPQPEKVKEPAPQAVQGNEPRPQPEPFKFEFDPAKFAKEKAGKQP